MNTSLSSDVYLNTEEQESLTADQLIKKLDSIILELGSLYLEKRNIGLELKRLDVVQDEEEVADCEWRLKQLRSEETSLHKIGSMLQSRLKAEQI